ncbi:hypothetical protein [Aurantiacibacter gangjinensis]|uniref:Uncharacterized protein n=1 Tax=Aurantiacibacter gangjinensis TaxID=502682 RepID=A0A0G9MLK9_9SPHN|nr:hypothetical protein [Aurantiacibacter gangjinensis]APE27547.1 hypothetical protein BMF35_a0718 [Aurantiacibacter gangjinensis]KLE31595.1 hypothetical protein AAW01_08560 [Aurantiacibacter gangjinensis]
MKRLAALFLALPLAACGEGEEDFSVDVALSTSQAQAQLIAMDGGAMRSLVGLAPLRATIPEAGVLRYEFLDAGGNAAGVLQYRIERLEENRSRIHAALDLDSVEYEFDGEDMVVSEIRGENMLEQGMRVWADNVNASGYGSLADVNDALSVFSIAMQPELMAQLNDPSAMMEWAGAASAYDEPVGFSDDSYGGGDDWAAGAAPAYETDSYDSGGYGDGSEGGWGAGK